MRGNPVLGLLALLTMLWPVAACGQDLESHILSALRGRPLPADTQSFGGAQTPAWRAADVRAGDAYFLIATVRPDCAACDFYARLLETGARHLPGSPTVVVVYLAPPPATADAVFELRRKWRHLSTPGMPLVVFDTNGSFARFVSQLALPDERLVLIANPRGALISAWNGGLPDEAFPAIGAIKEIASLGDTAMTGSAWPTVIRFADMHDRLVRSGRPPTLATAPQTIVLPDSFVRELVDFGLESGRRFREYDGQILISAQGPSLEKGEWSGTLTSDGEVLASISDLTDVRFIFHTHPNPYPFSAMDLANAGARVMLMTNSQGKIYLALPTRNLTDFESVATRATSTLQMVEMLEHDPVRAQDTLAGALAARLGIALYRGTGPTLERVAAPVQSTDFPLFGARGTPARLTDYERLHLTELMAVIQTGRPILDPSKWTDWGAQLAPLKPGSPTDGYMAAYVILLAERTHHIIYAPYSDLIFPDGYKDAYPSQRVIRVSLKPVGIQIGTFHQSNDGAPPRLRVEGGIVLGGDGRAKSAPVEELHYH
jgi:hypothetical protein